MIKDYFRPESVEEALELLKDPKKGRRPLGGGTAISRQQAGVTGVVDLQHTGLDSIELDSRHIWAGAAVKLSSLINHPDVDSEIKRAIKIEANQNIQNAATLGGWLISSDGRSILSTLLLSMDTMMTWEPNEERVHLGDWLPLRNDKDYGVLLSQLDWPKGLIAAFEYVARSPKDRPVLIVAIAQWGSGRTRVALGGYGESSIIAADGPDHVGIDFASRDAYYSAEDEWATAAYRREVASKLALRCLERINTMKESEA